MEVTHTVLLVDLDLRKPAIHKYFGYEPEVGLADYLTTDVPLHQVLQQAVCQLCRCLHSSAPHVGSRAACRCSQHRHRLCSQR